MPSPTANLQRSLTVAQGAKLMNVSERTIYMARELVATGREDLCQSVERGEITVLAALKIAKPEKYGRRPSRLDQQKRLWLASTLEEQLALMDWIIAH